MAAGFQPAGAPCLKWPQVFNLRFPASSWPPRSGLTMPRRRTFASSLQASAHSDAAGASPRAPRRRRRLGRLRLAAYAGSRGTVSPSLSSAPRSSPSEARARGGELCASPGLLGTVGAVNSQSPPPMSMLPMGCGASRQPVARSQPTGSMTGSAGRPLGWSRGRGAGSGGDSSRPRRGGPSSISRAVAKRPPIEPKVASTAAGS